MEITSRKKFLREIETAFCLSSQSHWVSVDLNRVPINFRTTRHINIVKCMLSEMLRDVDAALHEITPRVILVLIRKASMSFAEEVQARLTELFDDQSAGFRADFVKVLGIPNDSRSIMEALNRILRSEKVTDGGVGSEARESLGVERLAELLKILRNMDASKFVKEQKICAGVTGEMPRPVFAERYFSIPELIALVGGASSVQPTQHEYMILAETLDRKMIQELMRSDEQDFVGDRSIDLNVKTILSDRFLQFDEALSSKVRGRYLVELQLSDVICDLAAYKKACHRLDNRGYPVIIDGVTPGQIQFLFNIDLDARYVKILSNSGMISQIEKEMVSATISSLDSVDFVFANCESKKALSLGRRLGFGLFQGGFVDSVCNRVSNGGRNKLLPLSGNLFSSEVRYA